jgi:hypothetical protein
VTYPVPAAGQTVLYVSRGSADGVFPPVDRAAVVTEVGDDKETLGLCVLNPTGMFFHPLAAGGARHDEQDWAGGTWPRGE